jgi:predicted nucleic acid-binding protein
VLRVVIDPGVLIAALISAKGAPRALLRAWIEGALELVVSPALISELQRVLKRDKFRGYVSLRETPKHTSRFCVASPFWPLTWSQFQGLVPIRETNTCCPWPQLMRWTI